MIRPLYNHLLLVKSPEPKIIGSLHMPEGVGKFLRYDVIAVGPEVQGIKEGDTVLCGSRSVTEVWHNGKLFHVMNAQNVYGIETPEEESLIQVAN